MDPVTMPAQSAAWSGTTRFIEGPRDIDAAAADLERRVGFAVVAPSAEGQDDRHLDLVWALWEALDLTPEGRGDWRPARPPRR